MKEKIVKNCEYCGKEFETTVKNQKFCSKACGNKSFHEKRKEAKPKVVHTCPICGKEFEPYRKTQKFCSEECRNFDKNKRFDNECVVCGKIFKSAAKNKRFCSKKCSASVKSKHKKIKKCLNCSKEYSAYKKDQKFCCRECVNEYARNNKTEIKRLPVLICEYCGKEYKQSSSRDNKRFCSRECFNKAREIESVKSFECEYCGKEIIVSNSIYNENPRNFKERKFCSKECADLDRIGRYTEENSANWLGGGTKVQCANCSKEMVKDNHYANTTKNIFCSEECRIEFYRTTFDCLYCGKTNETLKSQITVRKSMFCDADCYSKYCRLNSNRKIFSYVRHWSEATVLREKCFKRDNYKSIISGANGNLEHHHIMPLNILIKDYNITEENMYDFEDILFDLNNVVTLLKDEHRLFHKIYGYKCTKEQFEEFVRNYKESV